MTTATSQSSSEPRAASESGRAAIAYANTRGPICDDDGETRHFGGRKEITSFGVDVFFSFSKL